MIREDEPPWETDKRCRESGNIAANPDVAENPCHHSLGSGRPVYPPMLELCPNVDSGLVLNRICRPDDEELGP